MIVVREVLYCRPGKVRELVGKVLRLNEIIVRMGHSPFRVMTDVSGERFWTLVLESEAADFNGFLEMEREVMSDPQAQASMEGYHDLVTQGRREVFRLER